MKLNRIDLYLQDGLGKGYENTDKENELVGKFNSLYEMAKSAQAHTEEANPDNLDKWRRAYKGTLGALNKDGTESKRRGRQLRKLVYELVESKIDNSIPMPKMQCRYKNDLPLVEITENYLKFEADRILTKYNNDKSERSTYVDGTSWYKVWWDSLDTTHERSGNVKIGIRTVDQIIPQPGVDDYKQLEYIFERQNVSISKLYDLYGRVIVPMNADGNMVEVISCYYLNENRIVGLFSWAAHSMQVICNEEDWQIRKLRKCTVCGNIEPFSETCGNCGNDKFKFVNADVEILEEDIHEIYSPYEVGETDDEQMEGKYEDRIFATAGTEIPYYRIDQLPFVPRPAISSMDSIYGMSEVRIILEEQDVANKLLTKATDKTLKSGTVVTKPRNMNIGDKDDTIKVFGVNSAEEAQMIQSKQILADTTGDITLAQMIYDSAKSASGVTDSFQGKKDSTATSGKAKMYAAAQSAGRIESLRVMKTAAFAGVYELILKYLLAFSDEPRKFVRTLPNGNQKEMVWNKYMFLDKDKFGRIYYRDDFTFNSDPAATLSQNRESMWQETVQMFVQGTFGVPNDPRVLELFWNIMSEFQYPLAKVVLTGIKENAQHLPPEVEQMIMQNPQLQQMIVAAMQQQQGGGQGGARPNSGPKGNGATHASNVERTNERNRAANKEVIQPAQQMSNKEEMN